MPSRRAVLEGVAAVGTLAGVRRVGTAQPAEIRLDGEVSGWVGRSPPAIEGAVNPALPLEPGRSYRVTWTNADGVPHNFVVADADGNRLASTEIVGEQGASRTVEFEATPAMATYFCEVHPSSMRGSVAVGDGAATGNGTAAGNETATGNETGATEQRPPPVLDATTVVLGGTVPAWLGLAPAGLRGRRNPTLRLRAGREYELVWMNLDGVEHDFHLADAAGGDLADTSSREDVGDAHSTDFEATPAMATYFCAFHPQSMRGAVEVVGGDGG